MKNCSFFVGILFFLASGSCNPPEEQGVYIFSQTFDFNDGNHGWEGDYTYYPATADSGADSVYEWKYEHTDLPSNFASQKGLMLSCNNQTGDVFMFIKRKLSGLQPNVDYTLALEVELITYTQNPQIIFLKAGASGTEPKKIIESNSYGLNLDITEDIQELGNIGAPSGGNYTLINKSNTSTQTPFTVRSNSKGEIWLIVGTNSNYLGIATVYYKGVNIVLSASN